MSVAMSFASTPPERMIVGPHTTDLLADLADDAPGSGTKIALAQSISLELTVSRELSRTSEHTKEEQRCPCSHG
ncbi:hypothetical protein OG874_11735 [Nocardia sp. NBC_00565]|uniref:hypothetical protein n=1 Tax=Nocardia sp. NBC_00565 TaxID=2975993 RepID=UPI002E814B50|nr:hypothetical protein [Nocardia sp. NBC_00565]WUC05762.1 hypothetical protein OG874_11735 [Nocardia sp. NBC_00565]